MPTNKFIQSVARYAANFAKAFVQGKIEPPGAGDCWYCSMRVQDEQDGTLGERANSGHIQSHIEEKYYVPSLLVRAVEVFPVSPIVSSYIAARFGWLDLATIGVEHGWLDNIAERQIRSSIHRYVRRQVGLAS